MMTDQEWAHFVEIYREPCKARADNWALSSMLRAVRFALQDDHPEDAMLTVLDWESRMPAVRETALYKRLIETSETELAQIQAQRDETALIEYLLKAPPPEYLN